MSTINDRIGSQNVIRVLSNASAPPTRLANLSDVNSTRKTEDGLVLVWDTTTEKFVLTDKIEASTLIQTGIASLTNATNSTSSTTGALTVAGGVGIEKNLNVAANLQVTGISTFTGQSNFVGLVTTTGDLYVGGDLYVSDDIVYDEVNGRQINISGVGTFGSIFIGANEVISSGRQLKNIASLDATTTSTIEAAIANGPNTFVDLNVTGVSTFAGHIDANSTLSLAGISTFDSLIDANGGVDIAGGLVANTAKISDLTAGRIVYVGSTGELQDNSNLTFNGGQINLTGRLSVSGISTFGDDVVFTGATSNARWDYSTSDLILFDNTRLEFGSNKDFEIWHGGAHTYLKNSGGDLRIRGNKILLKNEDGSEKYLEATANQDVKLFFTDVEKMATTVDGVNVLGTLTAQLIDGGSY